MRARLVLRTAARVLMVSLLGLAPVSLGRLQDWETAVFLLVVSAAALAWSLGGGRLLPMGLRWPDRLLIAAFVAALVLTFLSVALYESLLYLALLGGGILAFYVARACLADPQWNRAAWWIAAAGGTLAGLWGLREYMTNVIIAGDPTWRTFGPFYNPNCLGGYLALVLPIPVALLFAAETRKPPEPEPNKGRRSKKRPEPAEEPAPRYAEIAALTMTVVLALALLTTGSKGGMLAALAAAVLFAVLGAEKGTSLGRILRRGALAVLALAILSAVTFPPIRNRLVNAFSSQQGSGSFRVHTWAGTARMIAARPLTGFGPGTFEHAYPKYARAGFTRQAHQTPLQLWAESGVIAGTLLMVAVLGLLWQVSRRTSGLSGVQRLLPVAAVAGAAGLWLHNLVDYTWYVVAHQAVFWLLLGVAMARSEAPVSDDEPGARSRLRWPSIVAVCLLIVFAEALLVSEVELTRGRRFAARGAFTVAEDHLTRVLPMNAARWVELSRIYEHRAARGDTASLRRALELRSLARLEQPTEPTHYNALGRISAAMWEASDDSVWLTRAEKYYAEGIEAYPSSTEMLAALGQLQEKDGREREALETYRRVADWYDTPVRTSQAVQYFVDENYAVAYVPLAEDALKRGELDAAAIDAGRGLCLATQWVQSQRLYRQMFELAGRYDPQKIETVTILAERAMKVLEETGRPVSKLRIGLGLHRLDRVEESTGVFEELVSTLTPGTLEHDAIRGFALLKLAQCYDSLDRASDAREARQEGLKLAGTALERLGEPGAAGTIFGWEPDDTTRLLLNWQTETSKLQTSP